MKSCDVKPGNPAALLGSAIHYRGVTYWMRAPFRHGHVIAAYAKNGGTREARFGRMEQGFITQAGQFIDRRPAAQLHVDCGGKLHWPPNLYSEDLW